MSSYQSLVDLAIERARGAMHQGNPVRAREWIEAAAAAEKAGRPDIDPELRRTLDRLIEAVEHLTEQVTT